MMPNGVGPVYRLDSQTGEIEKFDFTNVPPDMADPNNYDGTPQMLPVTPDDVEFVNLLVSAIA
jgi:hypothetical protein